MRSHRTLSLARAHDFPRIEVVATGNELLDGTIADTNSQRLAIALKEFGLKISRTTVILDKSEDIRRVLGEAVLRSDVVVVSGGLGPTTDDITLEAAAKAFGRKLIKHPEALKNVIWRLNLSKRKANPGNLKQAWIPDGSKVLRNIEGTAPGVQWSMGDRTMFFLPGVPREFDYLLKTFLKPFFEKMANPEREYLKTLKVYGVPESEMSEWAKKIKLPEGVRLGFRTHLPENHLKFDVKAKSAHDAAKKLKPLLAKCRKEYGHLLFAENGESFAEAVLKDLLRAKKTVAFAESCTGGLASSMLTAVGGSSAVFLRGYVTYSNEAKVDLLGVSEKTLQKFGAVSEQTAREMAVGALKKSKADLAVAITGIAGPTGGTKEKPVGTVWFACASKSKVVTKKALYPYARELNQRSSAFQALQMLREAL